jgi:glycosyltransferase involved in cell wall biosynthesis
MTVCLVAIAQNEARFLPEWLAHYIAIGIDRIFLFDNESSDSTRDVVAAAAERYPITYVPWPTPLDRSPQVSAYNYAVKKLIRSYDWACFLDCDEFLVLREDRDLNSFLARYDASVGALAINWLTFGSSGRRESDYELVTETFRCGSERHWRNNKHFKTIARADRMYKMGVHYAELKSGAYIHPNGQPLSMPARLGVAAQIDHSLAQVNHYQVKSKSDFDEKIRRGRAGKKPTDPMRFRQNGEAVFRSLDRNSVEYSDIDATRPQRQAAMAVIVDAFRRVGSMAK